MGHCLVTAGCCNSTILALTGDVTVCSALVSSKGMARELTCSWLWHIIQWKTSRNLLYKQIDSSSIVHRLYGSSVFCKVARGWFSWFLNPFHLYYSLQSCIDFVCVNLHVLNFSMLENWTAMGSCVVYLPLSKHAVWLFCNNFFAHTLSKICMYSNHVKNNTWLKY